MSRALRPRLVPTVKRSPCAVWQALDPRAGRRTGERRRGVAASRNRGGSRQESTAAAAERRGLFALRLGCRAACAGDTPLRARAPRRRAAPRRAAGASRPPRALPQREPPFAPPLVWHLLPRPDAPAGRHRADLCQRHRGGALHDPRGADELPRAESHRAALVALLGDRARAAASLGVRRRRPPRRLPVLRHLVAQGGAHGGAWRVGTPLGRAHLRARRRRAHGRGHGGQGRLLQHRLCAEAADGQAIVRLRAAATHTPQTPEGGSGRTA
eukprot:2517026-Prymnesium_polylepis.1